MADEESAPASGASTRQSTAKSGGSRSSTAKSTTSAKSESERMKSAAAIVAALSRPASQKSGAWSKDDDPEAGKRVEDSAKSRNTTKKPSTLEDILEEELAADEYKGQEHVGCWTRITSTLGSIWSTSDLLSGEETEERVRTVTRELAIYCIFMGVLVWVTISAMHPTMFSYTSMLKKLFEKQEEVVQIKDFWKFMENDFLDGVYWEEWYNDGDEDWRTKMPCSANQIEFTDKKKGPKGPCPIPLKDRLVQYSSRLLGVPRMRILRVNNQSCPVAAEFKDAIKVCYDDYDRNIEEESDFGPDVRIYTDADAWRYQTVKELQGSDHVGLLSTYSGAGSIQTLSLRRNETKLILRELKEGLWITRGTRYVSVDFTLYNANINLFCVIKLNFEFPSTGGIISHGEFVTVKLLRYITEADYALMGAEFLFAAMLIYYFVEEAMEIRVGKFEYFTSFWNCLDVFVILMSISVVAFNIYKYFVVNGLLKGLLAQPDIYADFNFLAKWSKVFQNSSGLALFAAWIKVFKFISFNKTMAQLAGTITKSIPDLGAFSVMFMIVFLAYAQVAFLIFGPFVADFSTITNACFTQFRLILGDFDFMAIERAHSVWGPVYFFTYVFFVFFVLMNMFMAILNDTYSEVKVEVENRREDFQMLDFLKRGYNNALEVVGERDKLIDIKTTVKLAADDGIVTFDEIRQNLRQLNFSDAEIEIFCCKYDRDGNFEFGLDEINEIEKGLEQEEEEREEREFNEFFNLSRPETAVNIHNPDENDEDKAPPPPPPTQGMMDMLQERVDRMENNMGLIAHKVNDVLVKLDQFEDVTREMSAKMRQLNA